MVFYWLFVTGAMIGSVLAMVVSGQFCTLDVDNGWPFAFYVFGKSGKNINFPTSLHSLEHRN